MAQEGRPFKVIFFVPDADRGWTEGIEYNCRFGDQAQVVIPRMKNDILDVMDACIDGTLTA